MTSPPKCKCGLYAVGECVDCDLPLCSNHGQVTLERFRCSSDGRAALAEAARRAEVKEAKAEARRAAAARAMAEKQQAEKEKAAAEREAARARESALAARRERAREAERAAERARVERHRTAQARAQEAKREADRAAERARTEERDRWLSAFPDLQEADAWLETGMTIASAAPWVSSGFDPADATAWSQAFRCRRGTLVPSTVGPTYAPTVALEWIDVHKPPDLAMAWGFVPATVYQYVSSMYVYANEGLEYMTVERDPEIGRLLARYEISSRHLDEAERRMPTERNRAAHRKRKQTEICLACEAAVTLSGECRCA